MNLYQVSEPRVLAAADDFINRGGFIFTDSLAETPEAQTNPWLVLRKQDDEAIPVIADYTTAYWLLKVGMGKTLEVGGTPLRMAGFLRKSILQSELITEQDRFEKAYPDISGWAFFLIDTPDGKAREYSQRIESDLSDFGFDARSTVEHLEELSKVENTYLATFQSLGGLGLLLGTFGLAFVLLRNILERRRELAMLRALGFRRSTLIWLTAGENILLLIVGLGSGIACALLALLPVLLQRSVQPDWPGLATVLAAAFIVGVAATVACATLAIRGELLNALRND
jgi:ABC-type lipoprotein release transport system permease subunit